MGIVKSANCKKKWAILALKQKPGKWMRGAHPFSLLPAQSVK
jgi:hypothetical protein